jgi:hypothetical protein
MDKGKLLVLRRQLKAGKHIVTAWNLAGECLLTLDAETNGQDVKAMRTAGLDPEREADVFQYVNHLLRDEYSAFELAQETKTEGGKTIDLTPTWSAMLRVLLTVIQDGNAEGRKLAIEELTNMAKVADQFVELSKRMPNGFESWMETHHEVVTEINKALPSDSVPENSNVAIRRAEAQGTGGIYELAEELTTKFETLNKGREWDGEFYEEIESFCTKELYNAD